MEARYSEKRERSVRKVRDIPVKAYFIPNDRHSERMKHLKRFPRGSFKKKNYYYNYKFVIIYSSV